MGICYLNVRDVRLHLEILRISLIHYYANWKNPLYLKHVDPLTSDAIDHVKLNSHRNLQGNPVVESNVPVLDG